MSFIPRLHPLDLAVILAFLAVNIVVGFWHRGRSRTFTEYAVGDKNLSTAVLTATIVATWLSGSMFFIVLGNTYEKGLYYIISKFGMVGGFLITGLVVGPRMGKFLHNISTPHILGDYYGTKVQAIAGISAVLPKVAYLAVQFNVFSRISEVLFGHAGTEITMVLATLVILYSTTGGVRSVTFTDVVQFFTFGMLLPILALAVWNRMKMPTLQVSLVFNNDPRYSFRELLNWSPEIRGALALIVYTSIPDMPPQLFQRMVMARNVKQIRQSFIWAAILCIAVKLCVVWIAILLTAENAVLEKKEIVSYLVKTYAYPGLKGFLGVGIMALAMSTIDSILNSSAVIIAHDILPRLGNRYKASIKTAKAATLVLGFTSLLLSLQLQDLLKTILFSANFSLPIITVPTLLTIFGFKTSRRVVLMAMGAGFITVWSFTFYMHSGHHSFFPGMLANLAVMLGAHYGLGEEGGWGHNPLPKSDAISADAAPFYTNHQ